MLVPLVIKRILPIFGIVTMLGIRHVHILQRY